MRVKSEYASRPPTRTALRPNLAMNQPLSVPKSATMTVKTVLTKPACGSVSPYCGMIALRRAGNTCRSIELNM
jgi:hypothetical protein